MAEREINNVWAAWLGRQMRAVGLPTASDLARACGGQPDQSVISRWLNEGRTPTIDLLRKIERPLRTPLLELMVRAGHISAAEARMGKDLPAQVPVDVPSAIREDDTLLEDAREHLLNQYALLRRLQPADPGPGLRSVARKKTPPAKGSR